MRIIFLLLALSMSLLQGCSYHMSTREPNASLVYGYIDMDDAPTAADYVTIKQYKPKPKDDKPYYMTPGLEGMFWHERLFPGSYQLVAFGGSHWFRGQYHYGMPEFQKNETALVIKKPGMYFLGSYKYKKAGSFFNPKFEIDQVRTPTEREVLEKLLPYSTGTEWEAMIRKRMGELK